MRVLGSVALMLSVLAGPAAAMDAPPSPAAPGFTFKRVAPPASGAGRRITVQIDPAEQARVLAAAPVLPPLRPRPALPDRPPPAAATGSFDWYWTIVPPGRAAEPGRVERALLALDLAPDGGSVAAPQPQTLQDIALRHGSEIRRVTAGTAVSPALVLAVIAVESAGREKAVSPAGAVGLMQLIPATAERFAVADSTDPSQNIRGGVAYLDWLLREFGGDPLLALAGYNAGENAVKAHGGVPPYAETRGYVPKVLAAWRGARGLCRQPPALPTDACDLAAGAP